MQLLSPSWEMGLSSHGAVRTYGGGSSSAQDQLKNVQLIQVFDAAFVAILGDGSVVTWGSADDGGDGSSVQDQLKNVQLIQVFDAAFVAMLTDGSVVTWGDPRHGGDSSSVQDQLKNMQQVQASYGAFAAILEMSLSSHVGERTMLATAVPSSFCRHLGERVCRHMG